MILVKPAFSHKINIYAEWEGDILQGEGYFPDGSPAAYCKVELVSDKEELIITLATDKKGKFKVKISKNAYTKVRLIINDMVGHKNDYTLILDNKKNELPADLNENKKQDQGITKKALIGISLILGIFLIFYYLKK